MKRIFCAAVLFASVLYLPWWFSLGLFTAFCFLFQNYYEGLLPALLQDSLYGAASGFFHFRYTHFLLAVIIIGAIEYLKTRLKFYS